MISYQVLPFSNQLQFCGLLFSHSPVITFYLVIIVGKKTTYHRLFHSIMFLVFVEVQHQLSHFRSLQLDIKDGALTDSPLSWFLF